jgi:hypothetical protein
MIHSAASPSHDLKLLCLWALTDLLYTVAAASWVLRAPGFAFKDGYLARLCFLLSVASAVYPMTKPMSLTSVDGFALVAIGLQLVAAGLRKYGQRKYAAGRRMKG